MKWNEDGRWFKIKKKKNKAGIECKVLLLCYVIVHYVVGPSHKIPKNIDIFHIAQFKVQTNQILKQAFVHIVFIFSTKSTKDFSISVDKVIDVFLCIFSLSHSQSSATWPS